MKIVLKTLCSTLGIMLGLTTVVAHAENSEETTKPEAILFKIHDIKPVMNAEGMVTNCDFLATFYNRTNENLRGAKITMGWNDDVSERYLVDEEKTEEETKVVAPRNRQQLPVNEISTTVEMPSLASSQQATVKGSVKTEKCFLLLDKINFNVETCTIIGKENKDQNERRRRLNDTRNTTECAGLFEYVDSKNPEYYDEFKNISYSEQERLLQDLKNQDTSDIENTYNTITTNLDKTLETLNNIQ